MSILFTAAIIARNEQRHLPQCLASIQNIVDEIILIDTGSTDNTKSIAREFNATVIDFPWCDDFSAARNVALDHSNGAWILYIDADEYIKPIERSKIEKTLSNTSKIAYTVLMYAKKGYTAYHEYRIFQNSSSIRFSGIIYESVYPSLQLIADNNLNLIGKCGLAIGHVDPGTKKQRQKDKRNLPLIYKQIKLTPHDSKIWWRLGLTLESMGNIDEAKEAWGKAIDIVRKTGSTKITDSLCYTAMIRVNNIQGIDITDLLEEALMRFPNQYLLLWIKAKSFMQNNQYEKAIPIFENLTTIKSVCPNEFLSYDKTLFSSASYEQLLLCYYKCGCHKKIMNLFKTGCL